MIFGSKTKRKTLALAMSLTLLASFVQLPAAQGAGETVNVWMTTGDQSKLLQAQPNINFGANSGSNPTTITVNEGTTYQSMDGFGAAISGSSAYLINKKMSAAQRSTLINDLFNPTSGIGISFVRHTIGASDFSLSSFTYDDVPAGQTDPTLSKFSITPDMADVIPVLKSAITANNKLKVLGSPWSPPAWMKTNGNLNAGSLNTSAYGPYANYFVKYIQAYGQQGVPIYAVTVQNEPHNATASYPSMFMESNEQANFIKNNLGPAFRNNNISTKILAWDHNWDEPNYPINVLNDAGAKPYIDGSAFHCYAGNVDAQTNVRNAHPDKGIYFTECSGGAWSTDFGGNLKWNMSNLIIGAARNWAKTSLLWNMALDTNYGPINGGCTNCRGVVTIDQANGNVTKNVEYYVIGHASKFVAPGAVRIESNSYSGGIENVAFKNPDGSKVLIALNNGASSNTFKVVWGNQAYNYTLPAGAVATFKWAGTPGNGGGGGGTQTPLPRTGWIATASSSGAGDAPGNALDGNAGTRWSTGQAQSNGQWFQVDMGAAKSFNQVVMDAGASGGDYARGYQVFVSNDGTNWGSAVASGSGAGAVITATFAAKTARYVRVVQTGSVGNWWSIAEFNATTDGSSGGGAQIAYPRTGWVPTASSSGAGDAPGNALDGNAGTRWSTGQAQANGQWFQVDMGAAKAFNQIVMDSGGSSGDYARGYQVFVSNDGTNWGSAVASGSGSGAVVSATFAAKTARYIRVVQTGSVGNWWSIAEFNVTHQ